MTESELADLWGLFVSITQRWEVFHTRNADNPVSDAKNLYSTWSEFVHLRAEPKSLPSPLRQLPSYVGEYVNALKVIEALKAASHSPEDALEPLLSNQSITPGTLLWHAKTYVVDEFITVMIVAGGFKEFGGRNYNGFVGGSRFNQVTDICDPLTGAAAGEPAE